MNIHTYELKKAGLEARIFLYYIVSIEKYCFAFQTTDFNWIFAEVGVAALGVGYMTQTTVSSLGLLWPTHTFRSLRGRLKEVAIGWGTKYCLQGDTLGCKLKTESGKMVNKTQPFCFKVNCNLVNH